MNHFLCILDVGGVAGGSLANARPCRKCLGMMRNLGGKRVHYSSGEEDEIISESVKFMFSIQDSSSARYFARVQYNYPSNNQRYNKNNNTNFIMTYSYGRALQQSALKVWSNDIKNVDATQTTFNHRAKMCTLAAQGKWSIELENK